MASMENGCTTNILRAQQLNVSISISPPIHTGEYVPNGTLDASPSGCVLCVQNTVALSVMATGWYSVIYMQGHESDQWSIVMGQ